MEVHDSPATITSNKEVDQLVTPQSTSQCFKRPYPEQPDSHQFETKRKLVRLNNQNQDINTVTPPRRKQESPDSDKPIQTLQKQPIFTEEEAKDPLLTIPLREKFAHLIPAFQSAEYTAEQKMLLRVQMKLDEHLLYLKTHRGRKRGDFFKRCHIIVELSHLKQILYIDNRMYCCSRQKDREHNMDILVDLPSDSDLQTRKIEFKQKLHAYLDKAGAFTGRRLGNVRIPLHKFDFEEKIEQSNQKVLVRQLKESQEEEAKKEESKLTLQNMFSKDFKFKEALYQKIVDKENMIKEKAKIAAVTTLYGREDVLKVLDEVHLAYAAKKICNMFRATLIDIVTRQVPLQDHLLSEVVEIICEKVPSYLKKVAHSKGLILQMDKGCYSQARNIIKELTF